MHIIIVDEQNEDISTEMAGHIFHQMGNEMFSMDWLLLDNQRTVNQVVTHCLLHHLQYNYQPERYV